MDKLIEKKIEKLKKKRAGNLKKKTTNQESRRCKDPKYYLTLFLFQVVFSICQVPFYPTIVWLHRSADVVNY